MDFGAAPRFHGWYSGVDMLRLQSRDRMLDASMTSPSRMFSAHPIDLKPISLFAQQRKFVAGSRISALDGLVRQQSS
nr:hypothetical protein CFP56_28866 [Quercus suber]